MAPVMLPSAHPMSRTVLGVIPTGRASTISFTRSIARLFDEAYARLATFFLAPPPPPPPSPPPEAEGATAAAPASVERASSSVGAAGTGCPCLSRATKNRRASKCRAGPNLHECVRAVAEVVAIFGQVAALSAQRLVRVGARKMVVWSLWCVDCGSDSAWWACRLTQAQRVLRTQLRRPVLRAPASPLHQSSAVQVPCPS
jgi:hypothetical protein